MADAVLSGDVTTLEAGKQDEAAAIPLPASVPTFTFEFVMFQNRFTNSGTIGQVPCPYLQF
jgi:hypothetical protein